MRALTSKEPHDKKINPQTGPVLNYARSDGY